MRFSDLKQDKGVAGLTILLSLIVMLFTIGLLVMIFVLMGNEMRDATYEATTTAVTNESLTTVTEAGEDFEFSTLRNAVCSDVLVINVTGEIILASNYTQTNCNLKATASPVYNNTDWNVSYTVSFDDDTVATDVMNESVVAISNASDWFPIFIVLGAMVVLILLTVIIITAIRSSGLMVGGTVPSGRTSAGSQNVGSA